MLVKTVKTVFSGFGGQGVIMMGYLLAMAGMYEEKNVTCLPSYGAEVRGGTANSTVVVSTEEIASPVASEPEFAVLMNNPALLVYQNALMKPVFIGIPAGHRPLATRKSFSDFPAVKF